MQFLQSIALLSLLSVQSLAVPIQEVQCDATSHVAKLVARANPPANADTIVMGETRRSLSGHSQKTDGLATCLAIVIRNGVPGPAREFDKILAHVSSTLCETRDNPSMDQQLENLWRLYDSQRFPQPQAYLIAPDNDNAAQTAFNNYVDGKMRQDSASRQVAYQRIQRNTANVNQPGGSRLWIDGSNNRVYWSTFDQPIA